VFAVQISPLHQLEPATGDQGFDKVPVLAMARAQPEGLYTDDYAIGSPQCWRIVTSAPIPGVTVANADAVEHREGARKMPESTRRTTPARNHGKAKATQAPRDKVYTFAEAWTVLNTDSASRDQKHRLLRMFSAALMVFATAGVVAAGIVI
jgi:hypothetical protein